MIGTLFSAFLALIIALAPLFLNLPAIDPSFLSGMMIGVALLLFFLFYYIITASWSPLTSAEQTMTPRVTEMFQKDWHLSYLYTWTGFFTLISLALAFEISYLNLVSFHYALALWIFLLGLSLDALHLLTYRLSSYFNPSAVVRLFAEKAKSCIRNDKGSELLEWVDALAEVGHRAIERSNVSLCTAAMDEIPPIAKGFLESSRSIGHLDLNTKEIGNFDHVSYTLFYILQRLEFINDYAIEKGFENVCSAMISCVGKTAIYASKCDLTLATYPLHSLGKIAKSAQSHDMPEVGVKAILMLTEIAKVILTEIDITYMEIKDPFLSIISNLEEITKETFLKDKSINIKVLIQPFQELKLLFSTDKAANHQDAPLIIQNIDRVIGEYESLELVMKTIPPIPKIKETP